MLAADNIFFARQNQVDHPGEIIFEFCLVVSVAPWRVTACSIFFSEIAKVPRRGEQDIIEKYGGIAFYAKAVGQFGIAKVFAHERDFPGVLCYNFLGQQTCWVGNISSVGPAHKRERGGPGRSLLQRGW